ncbi:ABC transporter permease [Bacillus sp. JJ1532]|uniref:ABC transporter permease n=1 Tax=unclassified Bacillus (in: firmicutes) TaxID=185979 RepID=UPI002FFF023B
MSIESKVLKEAPVKSKVKGNNFSWSQLPAWARQTLLLVVILLLWQITFKVMDINPLLLSSPSEIGKVFWQNWINGTLLSVTVATMKILLLGMFIGIVVAAILTTLATWTQIGNDLLTLLTAVLNPIPAIGVLPLAIIWFGLTPTSLVFVLANAITWPIAINVSMGFRTVSPTILMVGRNLGLRGWRLVKDVYMPAALPHMISGLKTGWAFGWRTIIAAELVFGVAGSGGGLGFFISQARFFLKIPDMFAGLVTISLIGILFDVLFNQIEKKTVIRWGMKAQGK